MKIRAVTLGLSLTLQDFLQTNLLVEKLQFAEQSLSTAKKSLEAAEYEVQTTRIALNSLDDWLLPLLQHPDWEIGKALDLLKAEVEKTSVQFCSVGQCTSKESIAILPTVLAKSSLFSGSVGVTCGETLIPDYEQCKRAAEVCLQVVRNSGQLGNFHYCASFNCPPGIPFFPAAYHSSGTKASLAIGLECGDMLQLGFLAGTDFVSSRAYLQDILCQALLPIQRVVEKCCSQSDGNLVYGGIDASINPGLSVTDSIGFGIENLVNRVTNKSGEEKNRFYFGGMGTLAAVSTITGAVKALSTTSDTNLHPIKLAGYSGLMLPVMEDLVLAARAAGLRGPAMELSKEALSGSKSSSLEGSSTYSLRDLLTFSSVCGVGMDTVPVPGDVTSEQLANIYLEVGAMAYRLNKPLSCRLLPMPGQKAGEWTSIESPYLCNTRVFEI